MFLEYKVSADKIKPINVDGVKLTLMLLSISLGWATLVVGMMNFLF